MIIKVFVAIVFMGLINLIMSGGSGGNSAAMSNQVIGSSIVSQAQLIQSELIKCAVMYSSGNNGTGFRLSLPAATVATNVSSATCPGKPTGTNGLFSNGDAPLQMNGFGVWTFINDATSARIVITATSINYANELAYAASSLGGAAVATSTSLTYTHQK